MEGVVQLIKRLRECTAEMNGEKTLWHQAADAIELLVLQLAFRDETAKLVVQKLPKWIPVKERLPERCNFCLVADFGDVCEAYYNSDGVWFSQGNQLKGVSHWMPLPQPPETEN